MNKMTGVTWFTSMMTAGGVPVAVGLVITKNEEGVEKAFLGAVTGECLEEDVNAIINWGSKLRDVDAAKALLLANGGIIKDDLDWQDVVSHKAGCDHDWEPADPETCIDGEQCNKCLTIRPDPKKWTARQIEEREA